MFKLTFGVCVRSCVFFSTIAKLSQDLRHLSQLLVDLFDIMCSEVPSSRPSASETLECVRRLVVSNDTLMSDVPRPAPVPFLVLRRKESIEETVLSSEICFSWSMRGKGWMSRTAMALGKYPYR